MLLKSNYIFINDKFSFTRSNLLAFCGMDHYINPVHITSICLIYHAWFRVVIGLRLVGHPYRHADLIWDFCSSDQRFAHGLVCSPYPASFRFHLTMDTFAFDYILHTTGRIQYFILLETCAARHTTKKAAALVYHVRQPEAILL